MNHQREGAGGEGLQVTKTLQLPVSLFNAGAQPVLLTGMGRLVNGRCIEQHPVIDVSVPIGFSVDQDIERDRTTGKGLNPTHRRYLGSNSHLGRIGRVRSRSLSLLSGQGSL